MKLNQFIQILLPFILQKVFFNLFLELLLRLLGFFLFELLNDNFVIFIFTTF